MQKMWWGSICKHDKIRRKCKICKFYLCLVNIQRQLKDVSKNSNLTKKKSIEYIGCTIIEELIDFF